ncbi:hypothetical protein [Nevskia ramosa]|uniref:hypothetical protein n=1 Tax=Nevskia ramosa TaxID=64002 RepID=UPI0012EB0B66|nr:hypothetical protein [Nevskia ramosa]
MTMKTLKTCLLLLPAVLLAACDGGSNNDAPNFTDSAVIATRATDYSSGAVSLIATTAPFAARNSVAASATSDLFVRSGGDHYFVVKRFLTNQVLRYSASNPALPVYTYSTQDATDGTIESNPSDLLIVSDTKAYLLRYGSGKLWIVNPSATTEAAFKIGEIDLSAYDTFDGVPEMTAGIVRNGRLYVAMQRLESFASVKTGYIAVIDIATNTEIDTKPTTDGLKGIELPVRDPVSLAGIPGSNNILVLADGGYGGFDDGYAQLYEGGIVRIDTAANSATLVFDDGDATTHPFDFFADVATVTSDRAYFISSTGFGAAQTLYRFNPNTNAAPIAVPGFQAVAMGSLAVDPNGKLWVTRTSSTQPGVSILGFTSGAETVDASLIDTVLTPINIDFITVPVL